MGAEPHAVFADLAQFAQAEYLVPAGVGEDGAIPGHEPVQPAEPANRLDPWSQIEVIGVAEQDLHAQVFQQILWHALYGGERADRHKDRCLDDAMRGDQASGASITAVSVDFKGERHS